jgi:hypothetical protein
MQAKCKGLLDIDNTIKCMSNKNYPMIIRSAFIQFFTRCYADSFSIPLAQAHLGEICDLFLEISKLPDFLQELIAEPILECLEVVVQHLLNGSLEKTSPHLLRIMDVSAPEYYTFSVFLY